MRLRRVVAGLVVANCLLGVTLTDHSQEKGRWSTSISTASALPLRLAPVEERVVGDQGAAQSGQLSHLYVNVGSGDSLYSIFRRLGLEHNDLQRLMAADSESQRLSALHRGQVLDFFVDRANKLRRLVINDTDGSQLDLVWSGRQFEANNLETVQFVTPGETQNENPRISNSLSISEDKILNPVPVESTDLTPEVSSRYQTPTPVNSAVVIRDEPQVVPATFNSVPAESATDTQIVTQSIESQLGRGAAVHLADRSVTVASGDSLYSIFKSIGLPPQSMRRVLESGKDARRLKKLRPGQVLDFYLEANNRLKRLVYHLDPVHSLQVSRVGVGFRAEMLETQLDKTASAASGVIQESLFLDGQRAGLTNTVIMDMANIFGWDVDFAHDIRNGDRFSVIHEELSKNGEKVSDGPVLAAEFVNRGRIIRALRYTDATGHTDYYSPDGGSMRKAFLRTPVNFTRISSRFSVRRKHPILHRIRAHKGVDYAAQRGTPVKATGDGKVDFLGRKGGYGKTIILRHGAGYTTLYAHLHRYARGVRHGTRVKQGQVIGYVGSTGLATGPHLHYEFRVRGTHHDPLTVPLPRAAGVPNRYRDDFEEKTRELLAELELLSPTGVAMKE